MQKMFSSTNNVIYPFAHLLSSSYLPPMVSGDLDFNDVFVHPHDLLSASSVLPSNPQLTESLINMTLLNNAATATATRSNQDGGGGGAGGGGLQAGECFFGGNLSFHQFPVKKPVKKDRHSKIQTAQGVRDRRVRLSINIARDFFDLQDMLGFDKASKTLEWLLRSSRMAIKELVNMKLGEVELVGTASKTMPPKNGVSKEIKMKSKVHILSKESRAKARARARERTKEKMCTLTQLEASKISDDHSYGSSCRFKAEEPADRENGIMESVMIKTKLKPFIALGSDQQSLTASMDVNGNNYFPNLSENWDRNGAMPQLM